MQTRTLYALLAAALLVPFGGAFAQSNSSAAPANDAAAYDLRMKLDPTELKMRAGGAANAVLYLQAGHDAVYSVSVRSGDGIRVEPLAKEIALRGGETTRIGFHVQAGPAEGTYRYAIVLTSPDANATFDAQGSVVVVATDRPADPKPMPPMREPPARERPTDAPAHHDRNERERDGHDRRMGHLLDRLERLIALLEERAADRPAPAPKPTPEPRPLRVSAILADERLEVGADGGRVAILIEAQGKGRIPLQLRYAEDAGWKLHLDRDTAFVDGHGRTWVWLYAAPDGTGSVEYVVQVGDAMVKGVVHSAAARTA